MQYHVPVLLNESVGGLEVKADGVYVDVTFGGGGHAAEILKRIKTGRLIAFDRDKEAIKNKMTHKRFQLVNQNFIEMKSWLLQNGVGQIDGLIADLGISSHQIDTAERGFSTRYNSDLDMRMDHQTEFTAKDVLNKYSYFLLFAISSIIFLLFVAWHFLPCYFSATLPLKEQLAFW